MLKIGEFSALSRISVRMLRYYDENGLLCPAQIDPCTGYRYYEERQLNEAGHIAALRDMGFGVHDIGCIVRGGSAVLQAALRRQLSVLTAEQHALAEQRRLLENALHRLGKEHTVMKYEVTCKTLPARYVASVRDILPAYSYEGRLWHTLMKELAPLGARPAEPCYPIGVYHDKEYRETDVDVEIQYAVQGQFADTAHVTFKTVPPIRMASAVYTGSYDQINDVNAAVAAWVNENGYEFDGLSFSIYHVSPHETQNPDELVTEVCYPMRKKQA